MAKKDQINDELNILSNEEIQDSSDLQKALDLINKEQVIPEATALVKKNFIVEKNEDIKDLLNSNCDDDTKLNAELDEIANQSDKAFLEIMDLAINSSGKAAGECAEAARGFLELKLKSKMAKTELKLKKMKQELDEKKAQLLIKPKDNEEEDFSDDGIVILDNTN